MNIQPISRDIRTYFQGKTTDQIKQELGELVIISSAENFTNITLWMTDGNAFFCKVYIGSLNDAILKPKLVTSSIVDLPIERVFNFDRCDWLYQKSDLPAHLLDCPRYN